MDASTANFYSRSAADTCLRYENVQSPMASVFKELLATPSVVLDVGAGSGRDMALLLQLGHDAFGAEPSLEMRQQALAAHPELSDRLIDAGLPGLPAKWSDHFDLVTCCAVLMHIPSSHLMQAAEDLVRCTKPGGIILISIPETRTGLNAQHRDELGRLFEPYKPQMLHDLFAQLGAVSQTRLVSDDALGRAGISWNTLMYRKG